MDLFFEDDNYSQIYHHKTREYFREVYRSYRQENYRAAMVMLYSVVICDLIFKLQELKDVYSDEKAVKILEEIEDRIDKNPKSSDWEKELVKLVEAKKMLVEPTTIADIEMVQKIRNMCAHPLLDQQFELYSPNRDIVRGFIMTLVKGLFAKRPILSKSVFNDFIQDIEEKKRNFVNHRSDTDFERYLRAKYLDTADINTAKYIFRALWKITYRSTDTRAVANRDVNHMATKIVYRNFEEAILKYISDEKSYFSNLGAGEPTKYVIGFLSTYPRVYDKLDKHAKVLIKSESENRLYLRVISWFETNNLDEHLKEVNGMIAENALQLNRDIDNCQSLVKLVRDTARYDAQDNPIKICIDAYVNSKDFSEANYLFEHMIDYILDYVNEADINYLLEGIETNDQTYKRNYAKFDHKKVKDLIDLKRYNIDFDNYPRFIESLKENDAFDDLLF